MFQINEIINFQYGRNIKAGVFADQAQYKLQKFFNVKFENRIDAAPLITSYLSFCKIIGECKPQFGTEMSNSMTEMSSGAQIEMHFSYDDRLKTYCSHVMPVYYLIFKRIMFKEEKLCNILFGQMYQVDLEQRDLANLIMIYYIAQITTSLLLHPSDIFTSNSTINEQDIKTFIQLYNNPEIAKFLELNYIDLNFT